MNKKELRALITLAGKIDPSLQAAMLKASSESAKASQKIGRDWSSILGSKFGVLGQKIGTIANGFGALGRKVAPVLSGIGNGIDSLLKMTGKVLATMTAVAAAAFGAMAVSGLKYASDLQEVQNVVDKTFGQSAGVIDDFASKALQAYGITSLEAKQYSSTMGSMLKSMGLSSDEMIVMSQNLTALSGDMASFYNLSASDAFDKIRAGVSGETEPLKQLGINMSVANLEAYALSQGIQTAYSKMSQSDQAILRYNYLMQATSDAQGDFGDTSDSFANQQKLLKASIQQTSGEIMSNMMPALAAGMKEVNGFIGSMDTAAIGSFVGELANMAVAFIPLVMDLMPKFGEILGLLLPPVLELGQLLIPILIDAVDILLQSITPLIPPFMELVQALLPPFQVLIRAVFPLLSSLARLVMAVLTPAIEFLSAAFEPLVKMIGNFAGPIAALADKVAGFLGGSIDRAKELSNQVNQSMSTYANGGFSAKPAIFGEAGLEAAIPIKPGNPRSISLLQRTAQMLGVTNQYDGDRQQKVDFTYAPVFQMSGDPGETIKQALKQGYAEMRRMIEEFFNDRGRLAWD